MSGVSEIAVPTMIGTSEGDAALADALVDGTPLGRCMARGVANAWPEKLADWFNAELQQGTPPGRLLNALANLQVQIYASFAGALVDDAGIRKLVGLYVEMIEKEMPRHAAICRANRVPL